MELPVSPKAKTIGHDATLNPTDAQTFLAPPFDAPQKSPPHQHSHSAPIASPPRWSNLSLQTPPLHESSSIHQDALLVRQQSIGRVILIAESPTPGAPQSQNQRQPTPPLPNKLPPMSPPDLALDHPPACAPPHHPMPAKGARPPNSSQQLQRKVNRHG